MKMAIVGNPKADLSGTLDVWRSQGVSPLPWGAASGANRLTQREENGGGRERWGFEEGEQRTSHDKNLYPAEQVGSRGKRLDS